MEIKKIKTENSDDSRIVSIADVMKDVKTVQTFKLTNKLGASVTFCNIGAGIVSVIVPDRNGKMRDVVLGYKNLEDYVGDGPCAGKVPGRFANRINHGQFSIDGKKYQLVLNTSDGKHHLHGGPEGFANQYWEGRQVGDKVEFTYFSKDGEAGYPGNLTAKAVYSWNDDNEITLELSATTDTPTIVNLTNHTYFNLKGEGNGNILDHKMKLFAQNYLPATDELITTGEVATVKGTPMDFTEPKLIGKDINEKFDALINGKGYDSCWVIDGYKKGEIHQAAALMSEESGIKVELFTTQPGVQCYTGNWLSGCPTGKCGKSYEDYEGVALECQALPDSPNKPNFPNAVLRPGEEYRQTIKFKFSNF